MSARNVISFGVQLLSDSWRLIRPLVIGVVVGALALGSVASVAADPGRNHALRVLFHDTSFTSTQADPSGNVFVPGDVFTLGGTILRFENPHEQIGTVGGVFTATGAGGSSILADVVWSLPGGKISAQTLFDLQTELLAPSRKLAITGGTGIYRHASGEVTVTTLSSGDELMDFTFDN
jgi:hypothetical protein